jgi:spermidine synthase
MADEEASPAALLASSSRWPRRAPALLATAGASLLRGQYVVVREVGSTFFSTELVALAATLVTLAGPSLGYAVAPRVGERLLAAWGGLWLVGQFGLPFGVRALVGTLGAAGQLWAAPVVTGLVVLLLSGFPAVFLPRLATRPVGQQATLAALYAHELLGALGGLGLVALAPSWRALLVLHWTLASLVLMLGLELRAGRWLLALVSALFTLGLGLAQPMLDQAAARVYYRGMHDTVAPRMVATTYSPYQRIDVVDDPSGRSLYLDGVPFYRSGDLDAFDVFLAAVPGSLHRGRGAALVVGSGSFASAAALRHEGYRVTVVELDAAVARLGWEHFQAVHRLTPGEVELVVDDGRRFLARDPHRYDVIVLDVPAPFHLQTALLHTPDFYRLVAAHLGPGGVAALSLCGSPGTPIADAIAASALVSFGEVLVLEPESVGFGLLYAGARLPFSLAEAQAALTARDPQGGTLHDDAAVRQTLAGITPLGPSHLAGVLALARLALPWRP